MVPPSRSSPARGRTQEICSQEISWAQSEQIGFRMNDMRHDLSLVQRAAHAVPGGLNRRVRGLSDQAIAWLFITPTIVLLLAINIFPLIWTIWLSFTNYRANRPNAPIRAVGIENYHSILTDPDIWAAMQATAHFVFWTIVLQIGRASCRERVEVSVGGGA